MCGCMRKRTCCAAVGMVSCIRLHFFRAQKYSIIFCIPFPSTGNPASMACFAKASTTSAGSWLGPHVMVPTPSISSLIGWAMAGMRSSNRLHFRLPQKYSSICFIVPPTASGARPASTACCAKASTTSAGSAFGGHVTSPTPSMVTFNGPTGGFRLIRRQDRRAQKYCIIWTIPFPSIWAPCAIAAAVNGVISDLGRLDEDDFLDGEPTSIPETGPSRLH